ncbi:MAG: alcohol dehydrogenase catalytic domain-containing protein [Candidatus Omnitrophota bacterium]
MHVAMYYNNNDVRYEEMPKPKIERGEILVKMMASGICGSDCMQWYRIKKAPLVLGHEVAGVVSEIAEGVDNFKTGDRVCISHHVPCNCCRYCLNGYHTACEMLRTTNFFPGGFSEFIRVPKVNVERGTLLLPDEVSFEEGTFIEPLGCVVRGQREAKLSPGQHVLILGAGISGILHLLSARASGCGRIIVTDIDKSRLKYAREFGADLAINANEDISSRIKKDNGGRLCDLVIICTSAKAAFNQALKCVDRGATILCFAPTEPGVTLPLPVNDFWKNSIKITHSYASSPLDSAIALELIQRKVINVAKMITHRISLKDAGSGFKLVSEGKNSLKVIIEPAL